MKRLVSIILRNPSWQHAVVIALVGLPVAGFSQSKEIDWKLLNEVRSSGYAKMRTVPYRSKYSIEEFDGKRGTRIHTSLSISEHLPTGEYHVVETEDDKPKIERIYVDKRRFIRSGDARWIEEPGGGMGSGGGIGSGSGDRPQIIAKYEYRGSQTVNGSECDLYVESRALIYRLPDGQQETSYLSKYWLDKNGFLIKVEIEKRENPSKEYRHSIWEFEYPANIKIEAPLP